MWNKLALAMPALLAAAQPALAQTVTPFALKLGDDTELELQVNEEKVRTLHTFESFVPVAKIAFDDADAPVMPEADTLYMRITVNDVVKTGTFELKNGTACLPTSFSGPEMVAEANTMYSAKFELSFTADFAADNVSGSASTDIYSVDKGVSVLPLLVVIFLALATQKVELALFVGVVCAAMIVTGGNVNSSFKSSLDTYLLKAAADLYHQYVIVFTLFLSGLVGMIERSGGMYGLSIALLRYAKNARSAQMLAFICGFLIFFDDYSNALVVGASMRPVLDSLFVSREKLAFIVDATSAPIAAIVPVSSWIAFETGEIQKQLTKIQASYPKNAVPAEIDGATGFSVYIKSLPFRFYPIFMIFFQVILIITKREFGPMLIAERKTQVYKRTDGGDAAMANSRKLSDINKPKKDTPLRAFNMLIPILILVFLVIWTMFYGAVQSVDEVTFDSVLGAVDSYAALLYSTIAAAIITAIFYAIQFKEDGNIVPPNPAGYCRKSQASVIGVNIDDEDEITEAGARPLLFPSESIDAFLHGMAAIFPAIVVLVLAWTIADAMGAIGADRFFASALEGSGIQGGLPALTFILSLFMALCTGTSWGTMGIMYPLTLVSAWKIAESSGDYSLFYGTVASILSGAVCGDHCSPISDTTVLSSVATQCELTAHVFTQLPYALFVALVSVLLGFLPAGFGMPAVVGILVGPVVMLGFVFLYAKPVLSSTGSFDLLTELYLKVAKQDQLREDTINYDPSAEPADAVDLPSKVDEEL